MQTFKNCAAQGDVMFVRVDKIPANAKRIEPKNGVYIVAHSETGHHHVIAENDAVHMYDTEDPLVSYLEVIKATEETETLLEHLRSWDTHETLKFPVGNFQVSRQRELAPEGWRRAQD